MWNEYYVNLFESLKADINQFIVERPPYDKIIALGTRSKPINKMIKFYWASEYNNGELVFISNHLKRIKNWVLILSKISSHT